MKPNNNDNLAKTRRKLFKRKLPIALIAGFLLLVGLFSIKESTSQLGALPQFDNPIILVEENVERSTPSVKAAAAVNRGGYEGEPIPDKPVFYVNTSGNDSSGDGSSENPYKTVGQAVNMLPDGGTVVLQSDTTMGGGKTIEDRTIKVMADPSHNASYKFTGSAS